MLDSYKCKFDKHVYPILRFKPKIFYHKNQFAKGAKKWVGRREHLSKFLQEDGVLAVENLKI